MNVEQNFSLDKVFKSIEPTQDISAFPVEKRHVGPPVGFPTLGNHRIRWFLGPENGYFRPIVVHNFGNHLRTHCPDLFQGKKPNEKHPRCEICRLAKQRSDWQLEAKFLYMIYGLLLDTDNAKNYWQLGKVQLIAGRIQMKRALEEMVKSLRDKDMGLLTSLFNPHVEGYATQVSITKGSQRRYPVEITPVRDKPLPPIELGEWYKPLSECWLPEEFNISDYEEVLAALKNSRS